MHRINKTTNSRKSKVVPTMEFMMIANKNGYKTKTIAKCALQVFIKTDNKIWYDISKLIEKINRIRK